VRRGEEHLGDEVWGGRLARRRGEEGKEGSGRGDGVVDLRGGGEHGM
jgi:hypothetical protein